METGTFSAHFCNSFSNHAVVLLKTSLYGLTKEMGSLLDPGTQKPKLSPCTYSHQGTCGLRCRLISTIPGTHYLKLHPNSLKRYLVTAYSGLSWIPLINISWVPTVSHALWKAKLWQIRQPTPAQLDLNLNIWKAKRWGKYPGRKDFLVKISRRQKDD